MTRPKLGRCSDARTAHQAIPDADTISRPRPTWSGFHEIFHP
jgi:hypothetical protein